MPQVPTYGLPRVDPANLPNAYQAPINDNAGATLDAGLQSLGSGLASFGQGMDQLAAHQDEAAVKQADLQYGQLETKALYDADTGLMHQQGKAALDLAPTVREQLSAKQNDLMASAQNDRQRKMLAQLFQARQLQTDQMVDGFLHSQTVTYNDQMSAARITSLTDEGQRAYSVDPQVALTKLQAAQDEQQAMDVRQGIPVDYHTVNQLKLSSGFWSGVAKSYVAANDPLNADKVLKEHAGEMTFADRTALETPVADALSVMKAQSAAINTATAGVAGAHSDDSSTGGTRLAPAKLPASPAAGVNAVADQIRTQAKANGATPQRAEALVRDAMFESTLNPNADKGSNQGAFQFSTAKGPHGEPSTWDRFGSGDPHNINDAVKAKLKLDAYNQARLAKALGRQPTDEEMYIAHQQGEAGGPALLTAPPETNAVAALEGAGVSHARAVASIRGNLKTSLRSQAETITAGQFVDYLKDTWSGGVTQGVAQTAHTPVAQGTPTQLPDRETYINQVVAQAGSDPVQQARNRTAAITHWDQMHAAETSKWDAADQAVQPLVQAHVPVSQWPADKVAALKPSDLTKYLEADSKGPNRPTDPLFMATLRDQYASNPAAFLQAKPADVLPHLSNEDFKSYTDWRAEALKNQGKVPTEHMVTTKRIAAMARTGLYQNSTEAPWVSLTTDGSIVGPSIHRPQAIVQQEAAVLNRLVTAVQTQVSNYVARDPQHRQPDDGHLQKMIDAELLSGSWRAVDAGGKEQARSHMPVFFAPPGARVTYDIPNASRQALRQQYVQKYGVPPTEAQIQAAYPRMKQAGLL